MKLLILGGTVFVGRHVVEAALARGHDVTMFNRGMHNPELFPQVEKLRGDRDGGLAALEDGRWDAVIDTSGYIPRLVRDSAELLATRADHYLFVSSISAYADFSQMNQDESAPLATMDDPSVEEVTGDSYGPLKVLCEQAAEVTMPGRVAVVRPGLIVGPHDPTDRFTYWPVRVAGGGEVLVPEQPDYPAEFTDVRDLAEWMIHVSEAQLTGIFNASGPAGAYTLGDLLETCRQVSDSDARVSWVGEAFLREHGVTPWRDLPLWIGGGEEYAGFSTFASDRAQAEGLSYRAAADTVRDTLAWARTRDADHEWKAGMDAAREKDLLDAWHRHGQ